MMMKESAPKSFSFSGSFDSRKASRDARARPWLTNSVLRGQSTAAGFKVSKDAPLLSKTTTVTLVSDPPPTATVKCASVKQSLSKIPVLRQRCGTTSLDKESVPGKDKPTATPPTVTGEATSASRIPVRSKVSSSGRPAVQQVEPSKPLVVHARSPVDKEVGKKNRGPGGTVVRPAGVRQPFEEMSIQSCINPKPIRSHRSDIRVKSILKHRVKPSGETDPYCPPSAGQGVTPDPVQKRVTFASSLESLITPARCWPRGLVPQWRCRLCDSCGHEGWCLSLVGARKEMGLQAIDVWLKDQRIRGYDYLEHSGGFLSERGSHPPDEPMVF